MIGNTLNLLVKTIYDVLNEFSMSKGKKGTYVALFDYSDVLGISVDAIERRLEKEIEMLQEAAQYIKESLNNSACNASQRTTQLKDLPILPEGKHWTVWDINNTFEDAELMRKMIDDNINQYMKLRDKYDAALKILFELFESLHSIPTAAYSQDDFKKIKKMFYDILFEEDNIKSATKC